VPATQRACLVLWAILESTTREFGSKVTPLVWDCYHMLAVVFTYAGLATIWLNHRLIRVNAVDENCWLLLVPGAAVVRG